MNAQTIGVELEAEIAYTTSGDTQIQMMSWTVPTWHGQDRAEAHAPEQEQPDR